MRTRWLVQDFNSARSVEQWLNSLEDAGHLCLTVHSIVVGHYSQDGHALEPWYVVTVSYREEIKVE